MKKHVVTRRSLTGQVLKYIRFLVEDTRTYQYENKEGLLRPAGTVSVTLASKKGALRPAVPPTAILQDIQGPYVWVLGEGNRAERRSVARGDLTGDWVLIEKGVKVGERIVADGAHKAKRGMTIEAAK